MNLSRRSGLLTKADSWISDRIPLPAPPEPALLVAGFRLVLDSRVRFWAGRSVIVGGAPWRVARVDTRARGFLDELIAAGDSGLAALTTQELRVARMLVDRGFAHPQPLPLLAEDVGAITVVVPAFGHTETLRACLASLRGNKVVVVDDGSADESSIADVAGASGARVVRHNRNRGPAAARNSGLGATSGDLVAFVDSDCVVPPEWLERLAAHFADPRVAMVAPRVLPDVAGRSLLARYEATRSSLDMGSQPQQVRPGARLGFVPSAALVVRRAAVTNPSLRYAGAFDEALRLGEDVDLVWRLTDAGWHVRFDPAVVVIHRARTKPREWMLRRFQYGTSAANLAVRHPGRLAPVRVSAWNLAAFALLVHRRPAAALGVAGTASVLVARRLRSARSGAPMLAPVIVFTGLVADVAGLGLALRREWWPVGVGCLLAVRRSRTASAGVGFMLAPIVWEVLRNRPAVDPFRYLVLRFVDDAAYGSGVIVSALRGRNLDPLKPQVRLPRLR
jgi:mycofactocin system glycosyltransferase